MLVPSVCVYACMRVCSQIPSGSRKQLLYHLYVLNVGIELLRRTGVDKINLTTQHTKKLLLDDYTTQIPALLSGRQKATPLEHD